MIVFLLLSACVCLGLTDDSYIKKHYGETCRWRIPGEVRFLEFTPKGDSKATILWTSHVEKGVYPSFSALNHKPLKGKVDLYWGFKCCYYELSYLTQEDSGLYTMRDEDKKLLDTVTIEVTANTRSYEVSTRERFEFTFDLKPKSCNINFISSGFQTLVVRQGKIWRTRSYGVKCVGFQLSEPCGILINGVQMACGGRFEVTDQTGNVALVVSLKTKYSEILDGYLGLLVFVFVLSSCPFVYVCIFGKWSSKGDNSETEAAAASTPEDEPVGPRSGELNQPSGTNDPDQPSYTPTGPLVHKPTDNVPPSYSEVAASVEHSVIPSSSNHSDTEPQFELKGDDLSLRFSKCSYLR